MAGMVQNRLFALHIRCVMCNATQEPGAICSENGIGLPFESGAATCFNRVLNHAGYRRMMWTNSLRAEDLCKESMECVDMVLGLGQQFRGD